MDDMSDLWPPRSREDAALWEVALSKHYGIAESHMFRIEPSAYNPDWVVASTCQRVDGLPDCVTRCEVHIPNLEMLFKCMEHLLGVMKRGEGE